MAELLNQGSTRGGHGAEARQPFAGMLWMALATSLFAVMNVSARLASARLPWPEVAAARTLVATAVALGIAFARKAPLVIHDQRLAWGRSLCGTAAMLCVFYTLGAPQVALGDTVTLGSITPVFIALLSPRFLGESSGRRVWVAAALATAGIALIAGPQLRVAWHIAAVAMLGSFFSALSMIWLRKLRSSAARVSTPASLSTPASRESPEAIVAHFSLVSSVAMVALTIPAFRMPDLRGLWLVALTGLSGGLAQISLTRAYALEQAARLGVIGYLGVVLSHILGAALLGDKPGPEQALGTALVIAAGVVLTLLAVRDARAAKRRAAITAED